MDARGGASRPSMVRDMADLLITGWGLTNLEPIGQNWVIRFVKRHSLSEDFRYYRRCLWHRCCTSRLLAKKGAAAVYRSGLTMYSWYEPVCGISRIADKGDRFFYRQHDSLCIMHSGNMFPGLIYRPRTYDRHHELAYIRRVAPLLRQLTLSPILTITPAPSWPAHFVPKSENLGRFQSFLIKWMSLKQRPVALSLMRTSSGPEKSKRSRPHR